MAVERGDYMRALRAVGAIVIGAIVVVGCQVGAPPTQALKEVRLQLQSEPQAQFAGYFAADREGYYAAEGLKVNFLRGGADILPHLVGSDANGPEFTISWVPKVPEIRARGQSDLVDIAQVFQRSGTRSVDRKSTRLH